MNDKAKCKNCTNEIIEEIAQDLNQVVIQDYGGVYFLETAKELYNLGYRKIPEGSVVLSKEEYSKLTNKVFVEHLMEVTKRQAEEREMLYEWLSQARKETVKEILNELISNISEIKYDAVCEKIVYIEDIIKLAKQFGVEVEE